MRFEQLALWLAGLDPWWLISLGISLVILDLKILTSEYLTTVSLALIMMAFSNMAGLPPTLQLWFIPLLLLMSYIATNKLYSKIALSEPSYKEGIDVRVGQYGSVLIKEIKNDASDFFYGYKKNIEIETTETREASIDRTYKIKFEDGEVLPIKEFNEPLVHGDRVKVIRIFNGAAVVSKET